MYYCNLKEYLHDTCTNTVLFFLKKKLLLSKQMPNQLDLKETEFQMDSRNKAEHTHSTSQYAVDLESTKQACTQGNSNLNRTLQN